MCIRDRRNTVRDCLDIRSETQATRAGKRAIFAGLRRFSILCGVLSRARRASWFDCTRLDDDGPTSEYTAHRGGRLVADAKGTNRKPLMRVGLLSDTHGFVEPFIQALARSADWVVHAGDIGGLEVIEAITPDRGKLVAVRGNNDWPESLSLIHI